MNPTGDHGDTATDTSLGAVRTLQEFLTTAGRLTTEERRLIVRVLDQHRHGASLRQGAQRGEGLRESPEELGQERHPHLIDYYGGDGTVCEHRRIA